MKNKKITILHLSSEEDKATLRVVLGDMVTELVNVGIKTLMLNQVSSGLLICDADRANDLGRGYLDTSEYLDKTKSELWGMVIHRAYSALVCGESFNPIHEGHKYAGLKFWCNYMNAERFYENSDI